MSYISNFINESSSRGRLIPSKKYKRLRFPIELSLNSNKKKIVSETWKEIYKSDRED